MRHHWLVPSQVEIGHEPRHEDEIKFSFADRLVLDAQFTASGVTSFRRHHGSLHGGRGIMPKIRSRAPQQIEPRYAIPLHWTTSDAQANPAHTSGWAADIE